MSILSGIIKRGVKAERSGGEKCYSALCDFLKFSLLDTPSHTHTHTHYMQQAKCMYACLNRSGDAAPHSFLSSRWHFTKLDAAVAIRRAWVSTRAFLQNRLMQSAKFKTTLQHFITPKVIQNVCCHHRQSTFFFYIYIF